mgnify:CR=1 FL=1
MRMINVKNFNLAQELTIGSDTWIVFPWLRKRWQQDNANETGNLGMAYKKTV